MLDSNLIDVWLGDQPFILKNRVTIMQRLTQRDVLYSANQKFVEQLS